jgi:hypothetical protein
MKLFLVDHRFPLDTDYANDTNFRECCDLIVDLILSHISDDPALFGLRHVDEVSDAPVPANLRYGDVDAVRISDTATLRAILRETCDPSSGKFMLVRSLATCRAVLFGHDGQAFVCLPTDAPDMDSPDERITVENRSDMLTKSDYMDGLLSR